MKNFKKRFLSSVVALAMMLTSFSFTALAEEAEITKIYADSYGIEIAYSATPAQIPEVAFTTADGTAVNMTVDTEVDANNILHIHFNDDIVRGENYVLSIDGDTMNVRVIEEVYDNFDDEAYEGFTTAQMIETEVETETGTETVTTVNFANDTKKEFSGNGWKASDKDTSTTRVSGSYITDNEFGATAEDKKLVMMGYNQYFLVNKSLSSSDYTISATTETYRQNSESAYPTIFAKSPGDINHSHWLSILGTATVSNSRTTWFSYTAQTPKYDANGDVVKDEQGNVVIHTEAAMEPNPLASASIPNRREGVDYCAQMPTLSGIRGSVKNLKADGTYEITVDSKPVKGAMRNYGDKFSSYVQNDEGGYSFSGTLTDPTPNRIKGGYNLTQYNYSGIRSHISGVVVIDEILVTTCEVVDIIEDAEITKIYVDSFGMDVRFDNIPSLAQREITITEEDDSSSSPAFTQSEPDATNTIRITFTEDIKLDTVYAVQIGDTTKYVRVNTIFDEDFENFTGLSETERSTSYTYVNDSKIFISSGAAITADSRFGAGKENKKLLLQNSYFYTTPKAGVGMDSTISARVNTYFNGDFVWIEPHLRKANSNPNSTTFARMLFYPNGVTTEFKEGNNQIAAIAPNISYGGPIYVHGLIGRTANVDASGKRTGTFDIGETFEYPYTGKDITSPLVNINSALRTYSSDGTASDIMQGFFAADGTKPVYKGEVIDTTKSALTEGSRVGVYMQANNGVTIVDDVLITTCDVSDEPFPTPVPSVAKVGEVEYPTLEEALAAANDGDTVTLLEDVALNEKITISNELTLDLGGKTITADIDDDYGAFYVGTKGDLTVKNGTITNEVNTAIGNYGVVAIENADVTGVPALYNFYYNESTFGKATVNGTLNDVLNSGDLEVTGGAVASLNTSNKFILTGGSVAELTVAEADYNPVYGNTVALNGGAVAELVLETADATVTKAETVELEAPEGYEWVSGTLTAKGTSITVVGTTANVYLAESSTTAYVVTYADDNTLAGITPVALANGENTFDIADADAVFVWDNNMKALCGAWRNN